MRHLYNKGLILILTIITFQSSAQDTIQVCNENSVYIIFPSKIVFIDVGNRDNFSADDDGKNTFSIKAMNNNVGVSPMLINTEDGTVYSFILYPTNKIKKYFYDYRGKTDKKEVEKPKEHKLSEVNGTEIYAINVKEELHKDASANESKQIVDIEELMGKMTKVLKTKNEETSYGVISDLLKASVSVIRNDKNVTYLKVLIKNNTSIEYKLDFISFEYVQVLNKGFMKAKKEKKIDVFPLFPPPEKFIEANKSAAIGYCIPVFGLSNKGYLMISFREKNGDRVIKIKVPGKVIQKSGTI